MSIYQDVHFVQQYARALSINAQQDGQRLGGTFTTEMGVTGRRASFDQIGSVAAQEKVSRHADTPLISTPDFRRWATLRDFEVADLIDQEDKLKLLVDPESTIVKVQGYALGRAMDAEKIAAFTRAAVQGQEGTGATQAFDTAMDIVSGSVNLTVAKLKTAQRLLDGPSGGASRKHIVWDAEMREGLLGETEVTSSDYNTVKALVQGEVNTFLGFTFHLVANGLLPENSGTERYAFAWREDSMGWAEAKGITARISERPDKSYAMQAYGCASFGAVRIQENGVVRINNTVA